MAGQPRERGSRAARKGRPNRTPSTPLAAPPTSDPDPSAAACEDAAPWGRSTADELEERLLKKLEDAYAEALARLAELGYAEEDALRAVLRAGHCYGKLDDPIANIVANASAFLSDPDLAGGAGGFADLRRLEEYSLAGLVYLLQSSRPTLSRAEAMWCLLSTDLRLEQAISKGASITEKSSSTFTAAESDELCPAAPAPGQRGSCHYHATAATATPENHPFDPETFMRLAMRQNPDSAAGVVSCIKTTWSRSSGAAPDGQPKQSFAMKVSTEDLIESVVMELESLDIDKNDPPAEKPDPKNEMVLVPKNGNFVEFARGNDMKDAWLDNVEVDTKYAEKVRKQKDKEEEFQDLIGKIKRRIANMLEPAETIIQALKRLKSTSTDKCGKMTEGTKRIFDELTEATTKLIENGEYNVYSDDRETFVREAEGYERLARARLGVPEVEEDIFADTAEDQTTSSLLVMDRGPSAAIASSSTTTAASNDDDTNFDMFGDNDDTDVNRDSGAKTVDSGCNPELVPQDASGTSEAGNGSVDSDYVYDPSSGYYYSSSAGYYYDSTSGCYCSASTGIWYSYDQQSGTYNEMQGEQTGMNKEIQGDGIKE